MKRMLLLFVVACGGSSPVGPDSAPEPDTSPEPDAAGMQYSVLYTRWNDGPEIVAGGLQGEILPLRRLDGGVVLASQAAVSPNGMRMAFTSFSYASSTWDLIVRPIAGTEADELVLAKTTGGAALPAWSHDGTRIAFVSFAEDSMYGVYVVEATGGTPRLLTKIRVDDADQAPCIAPHWSPDDAEVAFSTIYGLATYKLAGDTVNHLVPVGDAFWTCAPQWSPDGAALAFAWGGNAEAGRVARIARTGGDVTSLAPLWGGMGAGQVRWSRDGSRVAFVDYDYGAGSAALRITDPAGGPPITLDILDSGIIGGHPTWSPDGEELLYTRFDFPNARALLSRIRPEAGSTRVDVGLVGASLDGAYATWLATPLSGAH